MSARNQSWGKAELILALDAANERTKVLWDELSKARCDEQFLRAALAELVACKDLKEKAEQLAVKWLHGEPDTDAHFEYNRAFSEYIKRRDPAWQAARAALLMGHVETQAEAGE